MKKIFVAATVGLLFSLTPAVNAEVVAPSSIVKNPDDAETRQNLAAAWHELGKLHYAAKNYTDALAAFEKAVELAPDNEQFRRDRDDARDKVNSGAEDDAKRATPKFSGLG